MITDVNNTNVEENPAEEDIYIDDDYFFEYNNDIEEEILSYLQGWTVKKEETIEEPETQDTSVSIIEDLELQSTKTVESLEVERYWNKTLRIVESYIQRTLEDITNDTHVILEGITMWCAGLLWKKYNIRVIDQEDQTPVTGFGDNLINNAKKILTPYSHFKCVLI